MAAYYWIKLYDDILDDPKMGRLSDGAYRLCINLFLLAGRSDERDGRLPDVEDMAWTLRLSQEEFRHNWTELERVGIVKLTDGLPVVTNFEKRQDALSPAEKQRRYRDRKRDEALQESDCNDNLPVTDSVTKSNTDIDIDIDKESEREKSKSKNPPTPQRGKRTPKKQPEIISWDLTPKIDTPQIRQLLSNLEENRIKQKKPFTQNAANILTGKLNEVSLEEAVARLQTAVTSGWLTAFYPGDESKYEYLRQGSSVNGHQNQAVILALKNTPIKQVQGEF